MANVKSIAISIPGQWRDSWLYKNRVYLWNRDGILYHLDMDVAAKHISTNYGVSLSLLAQTLIFRNDWKVGEHFRTMLKVPEMEAAFTRPFGDRNQVTVEIPRELLRVSESASYAGPVLDTCIYADRLYLATLDGLLESYVNSKYPDSSYPLDRQLDARVAKLAIRYAAINASAEEDGLFFGRVIFGNEDDKQGFKPSEFHKVAEYSRSVSHAARNLLNYTEEPVPSLYRAKLEESKTHPKALYEEQLVVGYHDASNITEMTQAALLKSDKRGSSSNTDTEIEVLGNSNYSLLAAIDGKVRVLNLQAYEEKEVSLKRNIQYRDAERSQIKTSEVLETYPISGGFIIELSDSVRLLNKDGSHELLKGQSARVRTFSSSKRYKEALAIIQEEAAMLVGFHTSKDLLF